ncbi:MAG: RCC1 domain-containing protein [Kofleriaceae bacterium]
MYRWIANDARVVTALLAVMAGCTRPADREKPPAKDAAATATTTSDGAVATGADASLAVRDAGAPIDAQLPTIAPTVAAPATLGDSESKVVQVEMSGRSACVRRFDGAIRCWGSASSRELGSVVPYTIEGLPEAAAFHLGYGVLAVATRGGDVAIGTLAVPAQPKSALVSVGEALDVRVDSPNRAWAVTRAGDVVRIENGQAERTLINVIALSSREMRSLDALHRDGTVTTVTDGKPIPIKGIRDAESLFGTRCAHLKSGGAACWNTKGKSIPWKGPLNVVDRRSAANTTCTLAGSGVACSGRNDAGQLGTGPGDDVGPKDVAKIVRLPGKPVAIAGSDRAWCAVLDTGALACWGANDGGQLGDGTLIDRSTPVVIAGASSATAIPAPAKGTEPVAEADVEMGWHELPKACTKPATIPHPSGEVKVVSAYAVTGARGVDLWFADMKLYAGGYRDGFVVARGSQTAVLYRLGGKVERGRYRGDKGARTATVALRTLGAPGPSDADVLVESVEGTWICGTILDPDNPKKRAPFAASITKSRFAD